MSDVLNLFDTIQTILSGKTALRGVPIVLANDKDAFVRFKTAMSETGLVIVIAFKGGKTAPEFSESPMLVGDESPVVELYENLALNRDRDVVASPANAAARLALTGILPRQVVRQLDTNELWWLYAGDGSSTAHWALLHTIYSAAVVCRRALHFADNQLDNGKMFVASWDFGPGFKTEEFSADLDAEIVLTTRVTEETGDVGAGGATEFSEEGRTDIPAGTDLLTVAFKVEKASEFHFNELVVKAPDGAAQSIGLWSIQSVSTAGFNILLSGAPQVAGFQLWWKVTV